MLLGQVVRQVQRALSAPQWAKVLLQRVLEVVLGVVLEVVLTLQSQWKTRWLPQAVQPQLKLLQVEVLPVVE
jgi:hypothetical protein